jgi:hypothetical protein
MHNSTSIDDNRNTVPFLVAFSELGKKLLLASPCLSLRPSLRIEQIGFYLTDFHDSSYFNIFRKSVEKIQVSLKSEKNNGYFT